MIIDGKALALKIENQLKETIEKQNLNRGLAIILVGHDEASEIYVSNKLKMAQRIGIKCEIVRFAADVLEPILLDKIDELNKNSDINGIIVQLPIPKHLDEEKILHSIVPQKDVDGFNPLSKFMPATAIGVIKILESVIKDFNGLNAVVIGRSKIVGKPVADMLLAKNCTVTVCHRYTKNLAQYTKNADIVVVATGVPNLVTKEMVSPNCVIVDVGINRVNGRLCGDTDFENLKDYVKAITPVPGGVGPMTVVMLMENCLK